MKDYSADSTSPPSRFDALTAADLEFPALQGNESFRFACVPDMCDLRCCTTGHPLVLSPFEIQRISLVTGLSFDTLEDAHFEASYDPKNGFPLVTINREKRCRFLEGTRCGIYDARPLVCRLFPLGKLYDGGFRYTLLDPNPCAGFGQDRLITVEHFQKEQDTLLYDRMWETWVDFVNEVEGIGLVDNDFFRSVFSMFVYNTDLLPAGLTPDRAMEMDDEDVFRCRLKAASEALPRLKSIFEKQAKNS